jgi:hypothetical protein
VPSTGGELRNYLRGTAEIAWSSDGRDLSADNSEILFDRVEETSTVALVDRTG